MKIDVSFLPALAATFMLVFARIGTMVMLLPGLGELAVPVRVRLAVALVLTAVILPLNRGNYSLDLREFGPVFVLLIEEITIGAVLGLTARLTISALQVAGSVVAQQLGLGFVTSVDPTQGQQGVILGNFLTMLGLTLVFAVDLHHLVIAALNDSYKLFRPGEIPLLGDMAALTTRTVTDEWNADEEHLHLRHQPREHAEPESDQQAEDQERLRGLVDTDPSQLMPFARSLSLDMLGAVVAALALIAAADYLFQYRQWFERQKMSFQEIKEEFKQSEGDPMIKGKIKQIRLMRSKKRMMAAVPTASVIITNPTHFAVALKYDREMPAPVCVAKGVDALALKIREVAGEHDIPIVENPPLARALHGAVEIDQEIPSEHYQAVAEVIGYVMRLNRTFARGR